jgi:hypothetical protein
LSTPASPKIDFRLPRFASLPRSAFLHAHETSPYPQPFALAIPMIVGFLFV